MAKNHNFPIPNLGLDCLPVGIDIRLVLQTGISPVIHGSNFHRSVRLMEQALPEFLWNASRGR